MNKWNIDINVLIDEYQSRVNELTKENIFLKAYIKQLEKQLEEATTKVEVNVEDNKSE